MLDPGGSAGGARPSVSVVVASRASLEELREALVSILPLCRAHGVEVVVVRHGEPEEIAALAAEFPRFGFLRAPVDDGDAPLRSLGMAAANGDIVMFTVDRDPGILERLLHLLRDRLPAD